jgi:lipooligosaccharide transport system permease protein
METAVITAWPAMVVFWRQVLCWRTMWRQFMIMRLVEPAIFFYGLGAGFGRLIPELGGVDYKTFLLPGSIAMSMMFGSLIDGSYGAYVRIFMQRTWPSFLATPTRVAHIMAGEMTFAGLRSVISATMLLTAGMLLGAKVSILGFVLGLPLLILLSMTLMAVGYVATGLARTIDDFDFVWAFVLTPMMVFSGAMMDLKVFPEPLQWFAWCLPLTHGVAALRGLMLGTIGAVEVLGHMAALAATLAVCAFVAHRLLSRRLVD